MPETSITQNNKLQEWYSPLLDELTSTITESVFTSRWALIDGYHIVGRKLRETSTKHNVKITTLLTDCAEDMKISDRKLWYAVKFFDKYPRLDKLPDGKNISWNKIKTKYLTERTKKEKEYTICDKCGSKIEKEATSK